MLHTCEGRGEGREKWEERGKRQRWREGVGEEIFCSTLCPRLPPIELQGTVIVIANHGDRIDIPTGAVLENKIVSGNLRILDH